MRSEGSRVVGLPLYPDQSQNDVPVLYVLVYGDGTPMRLAIIHREQYVPAFGKTSRTTRCTFAATADVVAQVSPVRASRYFLTT